MVGTKHKGDLGEAMVVAEALRRGFKVALPIGEDWRYDLIVLRNGVLERVQCKYVESYGECINAKCRSTNNWANRKYSTNDFDWLAVYDKTTDRCYFIPSSILGDGRAQFGLRLTAPKNNQRAKINWAHDFLSW